MSDETKEDSAIRKQRKAKGGCDGGAASDAEGSPAI